MNPQIATGLSIAILSMIGAVLWVLAPVSLRHAAARDAHEVHGSRQRSGQTHTPERRMVPVKLFRPSNHERWRMGRPIGERILRDAQQFLRASDGSTHTIEPELLARVARVSDHFRGPWIEVISGYRTAPSRWTPRSNHPRGLAIDLRAEGFTIRAVWDFCQTLRGTGCGLYPRTDFVHIDVREQSTSWVDWSTHGQPPCYNHDPDASPATCPALSDAGPPSPTSVTTGSTLAEVGSEYDDEE